MKAAFGFDAQKGRQKLQKMADWLDCQYPSAAASLREGLTEMFTINRLGLPAELRHCLGSTNVIESPNSGIRRYTRRVKRWRDHKHGRSLRWGFTTGDRKEISPDYGLSATVHP